MVSQYREMGLLSITSRTSPPKPWEDVVSPTPPGLLKLGGTEKGKEGEMFKHLSVFENFILKCGWKHNQGHGSPFISRDADFKINAITLKAQIIFAVIMFNFSNTTNTHIQQQHENTL